MLPQPVMIAHPLALFKITSSRESLVASAREENDTYIFLLDDCRENGQQIAASLSVDGVHCSRPVERDLEYPFERARNGKCFERTRHAAVLKPVSSSSSVIDLDGLRSHR